MAATVRLVRQLQGYVHMAVVFHPSLALLAQVLSAASGMLRFGWKLDWIPFGDAVEDLLKVIGDGEGESTVPRLVKAIYFPPDRPHCHTIRMSELGDLETSLGNGKWEPKRKDDDVFYCVNTTIATIFSNHLDTEFARSTSRGARREELITLARSAMQQAGEALDWNLSEYNPIDDEFYEALPDKEQDAIRNMWTKVVISEIKAMVGKQMVGLICIFFTQRV